MSVKVLLGIVGVLLVAVGGLFIGQGVGTVHGSYMTGHRGYADLGGVLVAIGLVVLAWVWWAARRANSRTR
jgi:predicted MFS family arabinose efflux permease